ncbi:MAG: sugar kinase, partial [Bacteroidota bacterium]
MKIEYAIIVKAKTRLEALIERFNTQAQSQFYLERQGGDFKEYEREDAVYKQALSYLQSRLSRVLKNKLIDRSFLPSYLFSKNQLIIVIGRDGLVANTAKYAKGIPILAVNPEPERYDGVLLPFQLNNFMEGVEMLLAGRASLKRQYFAQASLNDGQRLLAFNDLFIGAASHISARYKISFDQKTEEHSSSGLIVSTQAGATGWLSSIFNMAYGVLSSFDQTLAPQQPKLTAEQLLFAVREPFQSLRTQTGICTGILNQHRSLKLESLMPAGGVIFSDGVEKDFLQFNSGTIAEIGL